MARKTKLTLTICCFLMCIPLVLCSAQANNPPRTQPVQPVMAQTTNIPYFTLRDGMSSILTLNNVGPTATSVAITIYSMEGNAHPLDPITLDPHSYKQIDLSTVVPGDEFSAGNIKVAYTAIMMGVTCQVSVFSLDKRVSFESREPYEMQPTEDMMPMMSNKLGGVLSLPHREVEGFLALTNTSANQATVRVKVGSKQKSVTLFARQTQLLRLNDEFSEGSPRAALVTLEYSGIPGDIITSGFVLDLKNGFSSAFTMVDPSLDVSSHLSGAHLRIGEPDRSEGFPENTHFRSPLLLANRGDKPVTAHVLLDYKIKRKLEMTPSDPSQAEVSEDQFNTLSVGSVIVPPEGVQKIELSDFVVKLGKGPVVEAGVDVDYDAVPGTLLGQLVSVDQTGDYSFEVPIKDPAAVTEGMDGIYPWTLDEGTNTVVHLKNTTGSPVSAYMTLGYHDSVGFNTYRHPLISLRPYETVEIDIQGLKDSKTPDLLGHILPTDVTRGQAVWHQVTPYSMIGRAEQTNVREGIARSFSCNQNCCDNYFENAYLSPSSLRGAAGGTGGLGSYVNGTSCSGYPFGPLVNNATYSWASSNAAVATVSSCVNGASGCTVSYVGSGSASINASAHYTYYIDTRPCFCQGRGAYTPVSSSVTVAVPTNFRQTSAADIGNGVLEFHYAWDSSSGNLGDLNACTVGEIVTYPGGNPYSWPSPPFPAQSTVNPVVIDLPANTGNFKDDHTHSSPFVKPYSTSHFTATQYYRYKCTGQGNYTNLAGPNYIDRDILPDNSAHWYYDVIKSGSHAILDPLP
jgi:hypothetical protein